MLLKSNAIALIQQRYEISEISADIVSNIELIAVSILSEITKKCSYNSGSMFDQC